MSDVAEAVTEAVETAPEAAPAETEAPAESAYEARLAALEARVPEETAEKPGSLVEGLAPEAGHDEDEFTDEEIAAWFQENFGEEEQPGEADPGSDVEEVRQRIERLEAQRFQDSAAQNDADLKALETEFEDILEPEVLEPIRDKVQELVDLTGMENLSDNAKIVRLVYQAVKAEQAGAGDEEEAGSAKLETRTGPSAQGEESLDDQYRKAIKGSGGAKSLFTR